MILIHTALFSEAKAIIDHFKLKQYDTKPFKIFKNQHIVLIVSGIGMQNSVDALQRIFSTYDISKAINIGTAGCSDQSIKIGSLFCTNQTVEGIKYMLLKTVDKPQEICAGKNSLYDMEGNYFLQYSLTFLDSEDIFVLKIVSDHCDDTILKKELVYNMVNSTIHRWEKLVYESNVFR